LGQALPSTELAAVLYCDTSRVGVDGRVIRPGDNSIMHFAAGVEVDGHDVCAIREAIDRVRAGTRPGVVIGSAWTLSGLSEILPDNADGHFLELDDERVRRSRELPATAERPAPVSRVR
jgi:hypothetical protein